MSFGVAVMRLYFESSRFVVAFPFLHVSYYVGMSHF